MAVHKSFDFSFNCLHRKRNTGNFPRLSILPLIYINSLNSI